MLDFLNVSTRDVKGGYVEVYPKFIIKKSEDLMIRGGDFYAIWIEERGLWSTDEEDAINLIDKEISKYAKKVGANAIPKYLWDSDTGMIDKWHKYCQKQMMDNFEMLDETLVFSNSETNKKDYASKKLNYPLEDGNIKAYDKLMSVIYSPEEREKIEWAIGAIVSGDSKKLQKFMVLYGAAGTGKSTILNIIQKLFDGYYSVFDAKALGSANSTFALEAFKSNPLVAIQHDGDLSKIEDNTRLNSLVSHELMTVNEKFKSTYTSAFKAFLFMGTNRPVKITDAKSGLLRRLIDVTPSGNKVKPNEYKKLISQIDFELGAIAKYCLDIYESDPGKYDDYIPISMMGASNDFYNFVDDYYLQFQKEDGTTAKAAWEMYKLYCDDAKIPYPFTQRIFREELKNYFREFYSKYINEDGKEIKNYYKGFRTEKFGKPETEKKEANKEKSSLIEFKDAAESIFDLECCDCIAQYATESGIPKNKWAKVTSKLSDLDTSKLHFVKVPENHIVIDFDIPDENGNKCFEKNLKEASKWPATYAELSKSGAGIHLHYIYKGDVNKLSRIYDEYVEIKVFKDGSSLRRKLTKCNNLPIATISSGLPLKGDKKMANLDSIQSERGLRIMIKRNLNKEIHPNTKPSIDFIYKILEDAYNSGLKYDVRDMRNAILAFAASSTHQAQYCMKLTNQMKFKSEDPSEYVDSENSDLVFFDIEIFPNLFLVNWKIKGKDKPMNRLINPRPIDIEDLLKYRLVGFNNRSYDNHMLYACLMGYTVEQLYRLSTKLVNKDRNISREAKFGEAFNLSYTDVYDFAAKKQSLKKWEIELGIKHHELGLPWDQPVPKELWPMVSEYCDDDVLATEVVFDHLKGDFIAREILADLAGMTVNDTTNSLTTRIIFGNDKKPQSQHNYRDMGQISNEDTIPNGFDEYTRFNKKGQPVFPGYEFDKYTRKSRYRGEDPSEGGYVYAEPGIYGNVALLDVASLHPTSAIQEQVFGKYTKRFEDIKRARVFIKHKEFNKARHMLDGRLAPYLNDESTAKDLAQALKIAINSVYGLTSARFDNPFKDPRNIDNIVAKRGALFMINLKHEVQKRGFIVVHIKTDSIKIADATDEIIKFVMDYGKMYGYDFEHEDTYDRICLVNDAVYIAKSAVDGHWTATGTQFQVPYVFKTLFSKEPIEFKDLCETKSVKEGAIYIDMNEGFSDVSVYEVEYSNRLWNEANPDKKPKKLNPNLAMMNYDNLEEAINEGHDYKFIGRVGQFCPIKPGCGGGILYRYNEGKYYAVTGTKGYRWLTSEAVEKLDKFDDIDKTYYQSLASDAADAIDFYGNFDWFVSDQPYVGPSYDNNGSPIYLDFGQA